MTELEGHGGELALAALRARGVEAMFTLSGGHVFPLYDAAHTTGFRLIDVRHEQSAVFAAEATAKLTRRPGLAVLTAGPGVTNGVSGVTSAKFNGSPIVVLGGRAPQMRWGAGSLQEFDHVPVLAPITKHAATVTDVGAIAADVGAAADLALAPHRGPVFLDLPMDVIFDRARSEITPPAPPAGGEADPAEVSAAAALIASAERPVLIAGSDVYAGSAEQALVAAAEALRVPVFSNGQGRGCIPADHPLAFARVRGKAFKSADLVVVVGTPLDFRLGFGAFGEAAVVHVVDSPSQKAGHVTTAAAPVGDLATILTAFADYTGPRADHESWIASLRDLEDAARSAELDVLRADTDPIKPARIYGELRSVLDRDAVVICDGGDFVSYGGRYLDSYTPGCWLDPGPYGCLGTGAGYAIGARVARPDKQICVLFGDGAAGFSLMDVESLVRQKLPVVMVVGNNGIWGLEKHPMQAVYGYDVAADLQPGLRYDDVVSALGGAGETVEKPGDLGPALRRAFDAGVPYLVNVLTDPSDAYPRSSNLA
ncbi:acetolactate synthase [Cryptosporangium phraense]|uniref:Acetolactate synthase n=1 Tax=Cryptosporangium phraense TaxID=2593070 RepID=A0A545ASG9_9ACTN|nr:acetolactate synthase [Cryptosporangium phraense]TQS44191.1 acetolactate synthase [Cryptosporangium phraense]